MGPKKNDSHLFCQDRAGNLNQYSTHVLGPHERQLCRLTSTEMYVVAAHGIYQKNSFSCCASGISTEGLFHAVPTKERILRSLHRGPLS